MNYFFKKDFECRLDSLYRDLDYYFNNRAIGYTKSRLSSIMVCLFKVYAFAWCRSVEDLIKSV